MSTLRSPQSIMHQLYHLCSVEHYLSAHHLLTNLTPANQVLTFPPIEKVNGRHTNVGVIVVVVRQFN